MGDQDAISKAQVRVRWRIGPLGLEVSSRQAGDSEMQSYWFRACSARRVPLR